MTTRASPIEQTFKFPNNKIRGSEIAVRYIAISSLDGSFDPDRHMILTKSHKGAAVMMNLSAAQNEVVKTEYAYKGTPISISITPTGHDRWHFNIAIQDPPRPAYGSIVGEVDKLGCPTEESVLRLAKAQAEKEINKANPQGSVSSYV